MNTMTLMKHITAATVMDLMPTMTVLHATVGTKVIPATALAVANGIAVIKLPTAALLNVLVRMYSKHTAAPHSLMPQAATNDETTDRMPLMTLHQTAATVVVG